MTAQDKLAIGCSAFAACLLVALLLVPPSLPRAYREHLEAQPRAWLIKLLMGAVLVLAVPYFYDELVGFAERRVAGLIEAAICGCALLIAIDVARFLSRRRRAIAAGRPLRR